MSEQDLPNGKTASTDRSQATGCEATSSAKASESLSDRIIQNWFAGVPINTLAALADAAPDLLDNLIKTNLFLIHVISALPLVEPAKGLLEGHIALNRAAIAKATEAK